MNQTDKPTVLITGAGTGIGAATAKLYADHGHPVVLVGRRKELLEATAQVLKTKSTVIACDLRRGPEVQRLFSEAVRVAGPIGILVNNAGVYEPKNFLDTDDEGWAEIFQSNFFSCVRLSRVFIKHFLENKSGVIVNVASTAGLRPVSGLSAYTASKAALISLTQSLALEFAAQKIRVNCVCPGIVDTPIHADEKRPESETLNLHRDWHALHPLGRMGKPHEVAWAIYQLSIPESEWMTGVILPVDGGISLT